MLYFDHRDIRAFDVLCMLVYILTKCISTETRFNANMTPSFVCSYDENTLQFVFATYDGHTGNRTTTSKYSLHRPRHYTSPQNIFLTAPIAETLCVHGNTSHTNSLHYTNLTLKQEAGVTLERLKREGTHRWKEI